MSLQFKILTTRKYGDQPGDLRFLEEEINKHLNDGWKLHGTFMVLENKHGLSPDYSQAMVRNTPPTGEE